MMKERTKNGMEHVVPLPDAALSILQGSYGYGPRRKIDFGPPQTADFFATTAGQHQ
jgi:hypothetical protein